MSGAQDAAYREVIEAIVADKARTFGAVTYKYLASIEGLSLTGDGRVASLTRPPGAVISAIVKRFEGLGGKASVVFCRKAVQPLRAKYPGLVLPDELS